jgi:hypothetical protein
MGVNPAKAGIHVALVQKAKMDSRFRGNDGHGVTQRQKKPLRLHEEVLVFHSNADQNL